MKTQISVGISNPLNDKFSYEQAIQRLGIYTSYYTDPADITLYFVVVSNPNGNYIMLSIDTELEIMRITSVSAAKTKSFRVADKAVSVTFQEQT